MLCYVKSRQNRQMLQSYSGKGLTKLTACLSVTHFSMANEYLFDEMFYEPCSAHKSIKVNQTNVPM